MKLRQAIKIQRRGLHRYRGSTRERMLAVRRRRWWDRRFATGWASFTTACPTPVSEATVEAIMAAMRKAEEELEFQPPLESPYFFAANEWNTYPEPPEFSSVQQEPMNLRAFDVMFKPPRGVLSGKGYA